MNDEQVMARARELYAAWEARPWYLKARDTAVSLWRELRYRVARKGW